jgi:PAS domain S-box-containing protein
MRTRTGDVQPDDDGSRPGHPDLLAGVPDAVYRVDRDGRVTYVNAAAEALLERAAQELIGRHAFDAFPASRGSIAETHFREVLADRQPRQFAYLYEPQDRWYEVRLFPDPDGRPRFTSSPPSSPRCGRPPCCSTRAARSW